MLSSSGAKCAGEIADMKARDIMVMNVITVSPEASVREVANLLLSNRISALPVVNERGALLGIISEGDLTRRAEQDTDYRRSWWLQVFTAKSKEALAKEYVKSHCCYCSMEGRPLIF